MGHQFHTDIVIGNQNFYNLNPLLCGQESCDNGYSFGPASRDYYLIHFIISGKGSFKTDRGQFSLSKGDLFIIRPNEMTVYAADVKDPWTYIWIGFECSLPESISRQAAFIQKDVIHIPSCEHIFKDMFDCVRINYTKELYLCSKLYELFSVLIEADFNSELHNVQENYVLKAKNYIETSYVTDIRVESIAKSLGIDRRYFCTLFKKHTGLSPQQYIINLRMNKAAALMTEHNYTPTQAALSVGYHDIFNFSRMFKKSFGVSPLRYKNKCLL